MATYPSQYYRVPVRSDVTWTSWTETASSSTTTYTTHDAWENWNYTGTVSNLQEVTGDVWYSWTSQAVDYIVSYPLQPPIVEVKESREERRAKKTQREINKIWGDIKIMEEHRRKEEAELTAQELLEDLIGSEELAHYKKTGHLLVRGRQFNYVIQKGKGVYKVEKEKIVELCIHFRNRYKYPETDNVIGLKLLVESDERAFLKTANDHGEVNSMDVKERVLQLVKRAA